MTAAIFICRLQNKPGAVPSWGTKASHKRERDLYKTCALGVQYGLQEQSLALRLELPVVYARQLLQAHKRTYAQFWRVAGSGRGCSLLETEDQVCLWLAFDHK